MEDYGGEGSPRPCWFEEAGGIWNRARSSDTGAWSTGQKPGLRWMYRLTDIFVFLIKKLLNNYEFIEVAQHVLLEQLVGGGFRFAQR